jgi:hypothetical protein
VTRQGRTHYECALFVFLYTESNMDDPARPISREVEPLPSQQIDPLLYRMVVAFLGAAMMTAILLIAVPAAVVGGLIGMLVPSPVRK